MRGTRSPRRTAELAAGLEGCDPALPVPTQSTRSGSTSKASVQSRRAVITRASPPGCPSTTTWLQSARSSGMAGLTRIAWLRSSRSCHLSRRCRSGASPSSGRVRTMGQGPSRLPKSSGRRTAYSSGSRAKLPSAYSSCRTLPGRRRVASGASASRSAASTTDVSWSHRVVLPSRHASIRAARSSPPARDRSRMGRSIASSMTTSKGGHSQAGPGRGWMARERCTWIRREARDRGR